MKSIVLLVSIGWFVFGPLAGADTVELTRRADTVKVSIDGAPLAIYHTSKDKLKPYFFEVRAADGTIMSRPISPPGEDHPHHRGIWNAADKVNGIDFWNERRGRIDNVAVKLIQAQGNPAVMEVVNHWLDEHGKLIIAEKTNIQIFANRLLAYDIRLTAGQQPVTFGDTEEGFFAFRMVNSMREQEGGHVENADGLKTAAGCWGKTCDWVDYYGPINGKTYGVALFDHPENFRRSRYHVRDYGLFSISPFGQRDYTLGRLPAQPVVLQPGETLRLRYGMFFHTGNTQDAHLPQVYREYLQNTQ